MPLHLLRNRWLQSLFVLFALLFLSGALLRPLNGGADMYSPEYQAGKETVSVQIIGAAIYMLSLFTIWTNPKALEKNEILKLVAAILLFAFLSSLWSSDALLTLRRCIALLGPVVFGLFVMRSFSKEQILLLLNLFVISFIIANFVISIVAPGFAFHQPGEYYKVYIGALRGTYPQKNVFAHFLGLFLCILIISGRQYVGKSLWLVSITLGVVLLIEANSAGALIQLIAGVLGMRAVIKILGIRDSNVRVVVTLVLFLLLAASYFIYDTIFTSVLNLVGRDVTLSSRTQIWPLVLLAGQHTWLLGGGYGVAWFGLVRSIMISSLYSDVGNAHNGYLETWVELGVVGLSLVCVFLFRGFNMLFACLEKDRSDVFPQVSMALFLYIVVANLTSSCLLIYNDLTWCFLVMVCYIANCERDAARRKRYTGSFPYDLTLARFGRTPPNGRSAAEHIVRGRDDNRRA